MFSLFQHNYYNPAWTEKYVSIGYQLLGKMFGLWANNTHNQVFRHNQQVSILMPNRVIIPKCHVYSEYQKSVVLFHFLKNMFMFKQCEPPLACCFKYCFVLFSQGCVQGAERDVCSNKISLQHFRVLRAHYEYHQDIAKGFFPL